MQGKEFYSIAAQVIPLLFVALVFQLRYLDLNTAKTPPWPLLQLIVLVSLASGEAAALYALYSGKSDAAIRVLTVAGLGLPGLIVWYPAMDAVLSPLTERFRTRTSLGENVLFFVLIIVSLGIPLAAVLLLVYALVQVS
jgi:hypothetical protein